MQLKMPNFSQLPPEVLSDVVILLDPIALISLSQTSRFFRNFIRPSKLHFAQRLLALELLPEHGGVTPLFRGRDNRLLPPIEHDSWRNAKYACCSCLRLRHHMWFNNHSILGLYLRKPPPGSLAAAQLTDWVPHSDQTSARVLHAHRNAESDRWIMQEARTKYHRASTGLDRLATFDVDDMGPIDRRAEEAEKVICGLKRLERQCLECRFQHGHWNRPTRDNLGTRDAPLIISRQREFLDIFERCFPGFIPRPPKAQLPSIFRVEGNETPYLKLILYVCRCFSCGVWQEMAAFRILPDYDRFSPVADIDTQTAMGAINCNHCEFRKFGHTAFTKVITERALGLAATSLAQIRNRLEFGWRLLKNDIKPGNGLSKHRKSVQELLKGVKHVHVPRTLWHPGGDEANKIASVNAFEMRDKMLSRNQKRVVKIRAFLEENLNVEEYGELVDSWFKLWLFDYEKNAAAYNRMSRVFICIRDDPQHLVRFLLQQNPYEI